MKHCGTQELETERLVLRRLSIDDSEMMYNNWASDRQVTQYLRWNAHRSWGETAETLNEWEKHYDDPAFLFTPDAEFPVCYGEKGGYDGMLMSKPIEPCARVIVEFEGGAATNAVPGLAHAIVNADAHELKSTDRIVVTGNPVRQDLEEALGNREEALKFFGLSPDKKTILVVGGSLGARTINRSIQGDLDKLFASDVDVQVIWQTGRYYHEEALKHLKAYRGMPVWCSDFITRMDYAYAAADLIISRAGASSISELCLLKKPVILVPSPNVAEDHQTKNALALAGKDAAIMVADKDAEQQLVPKALEIIHDDERLRTLSRNIATLAHHESAERIVDEIVRIIE